MPSDEVILMPRDGPPRRLCDDDDEDDDDADDDDNYDDNDTNNNDSLRHERARSGWAGNDQMVSHWTHAGPASRYVRT